jgi:hypothetical protein
MNDLLARAIAAHGGLERWHAFTTLTATIVTGGALWAMKGIVQDTVPCEVTVTLHAETASIRPFGAPDWHTAFTPARVAIETTAGAVVREHFNPRASFAGHALNTPWDPLHHAYLNGYALWTYLTTPSRLAQISPPLSGGCIAQQRVGVTGQGSTQRRAKARVGAIPHRSKGGVSHVWAQWLA